ncbi:alpha/beta hydrolase [Pseudochryseolinea flava]|nr:hypothetical protein [Pseudochryseolinea flava]
MKKRKSSTATFVSGVWPLVQCVVVVGLLSAIALMSGCDDPHDHQDNPHARPQEGGRIVPRPDVPQDPKALSTIIIVPPLLNCANSVTVKGFVPGALVRIYSDGTKIAEKVGNDPEGETFQVSSPLATGKNITATQEFDGVESLPSVQEPVQDVNEVYPAGIPKPNFPFLYLYNCGIATYVNNLPPGGDLRVFEQASITDPKNLVGSVNGVAEGQSIGIHPSFKTDHLVSAESQICTDVATSDIQKVMPEPASLPDPTADPIYEAATFVACHSLVNGAKVTIERSGTTIAVFGAPASHVRVLGVTVSAGDVLDITQELCGVKSNTTHVTVQPCSALPPPVLIGPRAGDVVAQLSNVVAGSRVRIYSGTEEIADGGGSTIMYTRPLIDHETLIVIQSFGACISSGYQVVVGSGLQDPGVAGPCGRVKSWEYGHGGDPDRRTTDVSSYFSSPGFCVNVPMNAVPLHAVVRYPEGPGPFPLVIIVHGNHHANDPSYRGYDYLLEQLASQCMIGVSVEEDFLNLCDQNNVAGEMDARGIVLLRHLQLWREWNRTPGHPFYSKVDMNSVGLSGHSRGGEAIVVAALLNKTLHINTDPPVGPTSHNFDFGIKSLYAIAPVDGQFDHGAITLTNADYYVMHGSHDGDVYDFGGQRLYNRAYPVTNTTNHFKGFVFVHGANHGQWNTGWGTCCENTVGPSPLISAADQQQIGKTYMSAFFLAGLKGWKPYRHFLSGEASFASVPPGVTRITQYQDPEKIFVNHYQEDYDPTTGSLMGVENWRTGSFPNYLVYSFSDDDRPHFLWGETRGLIAGWNEERSMITMALKNGGGVDFKYLAMHVGQTHEDPTDLNTPGVDKDFSVQLEFEEGAGPEVAVSSYGTLSYPLITYYKMKSVQQTIRIPFEDLRISPQVKTADVRAIKIKFNRQSRGNIALDEVQFSN